MPSCTAAPRRPSIRPSFGPIDGSQLGLPPNFVIRRPDDVSLCVGEFLRRADLVALVPVGLLALFVFADALHGRQRHKAVRLEDEECFFVAALAMDHQIAIPQVVGAAE